MKSIELSQCSEEVQANFKMYQLGTEKIRTLSQFRIILARHGLKENKSNSFRYRNRGNELKWDAYHMSIDCAECGHGWANEQCCHSKDKSLVKVMNEPGGLRDSYFVVCDNGSRIVEF